MLLNQHSTFLNKIQTDKQKTKNINHDENYRVRTMKLIEIKFA